MTRLVACQSCARHVRADDGRCPFCGSASTTAAPGRMLALVLPLTLMAGCTSNEPPKPSPEGKTTPAKPVVEPTPVEPIPDEPAYGVPMTDDLPRPADVIEPEPEPIDRPADKYGAPPAMDDGPDEPDEPDVIEPKPDVDERKATKYGGPPRPKSLRLDQDPL